MIESTVTATPAKRALMQYRSTPLNGRRARDILRDIAHTYGVKVGDIHLAAQCLDGEHCHGPGCRVGKP